MSHTKEPWSYQASIPEEGYECFWIISRGRHISSFDGPQNDEQFSNVRRIVACVNACAGIPVDMLEAMPNGPASLLPMYARLEKQRDEYQSERQREHDLRVLISGDLETVTKQRDELLAALEYVISDLELRASLKEDDERGEVDIGNGCYEQALAAIARVKGQQ